MKKKYLCYKCGKLKDEENFLRKGFDCDKCREERYEEKYKKNKV